ncbi:hypothetical protein WA026_006970 [Henosepilachna vigintioctopunctata]|uniref:Protein kintoun n=1 Tax=Henosepilachna vigintioctopunctata TaxID=420089 RepID=A0AAW1V8Y0_9CUCU
MEGSHSFSKLRDLDLSRDEINRLGEALKKDEFRNLLIDYVKEIQDPENQKLYEKEMTQLEKERGNDITFLHPTPCYVIKTSINGTKKCFINICGNDLVKKPSSVPSEKDGERGLQWSLPHSMSPPSDDVDNKGVRCQVYDVLFHPDTLHLAQKNKAFRNMVNKTACNGIEAHFDVKLDKNNLKFPNIKYKGMAKASVIRKPSADGPIQRSPEEKAFFDKLYAQADESTQSHKKPKKNKKTATKIENCNEKSRYTTPKYIIKHRRHVELEEFTEHKASKMNSAIPKELIVEVNLPLLRSANDITLDVTEKTVQLISEKPAQYKLNLSLPYQVNQDSGNAKFDKDLKKLVITLPVRRKPISITVNDFNREDSGVDSDHGSPVSLESEEEFHPISLISEKEIVSESPVKTVPQFWTKFLDENIHYTIPEFTCNVFDNTIAFTLNVKNVDTESIAKFIDEGSKSIHVKFVSVSPSFYQFHYAFLVKLPVISIDPNSVSIEVWDNNVILQIPFYNCDKECISYMYGVCEEELQQNYVEEPHIVNTIFEHNHTLNVINEEPESILNSNNEGKFTEKVNSESKISFNYDSDDNGTKAMVKNVLVCSESDSKDFSRNINLAVSYESSGDELSLSPCKNRGILKRHFPTTRKSFSRSISESSLDDCIGSMDHEGMDSAIPEDNESGAEISTSLKKTVRFNDVVSKQLFRFNSSILGQKKKNQRKAQKKKKALERRHSESETSEVDDKKDGDHFTESDCDPSMSKYQMEKVMDSIFFLDM